MDVENDDGSDGMSSNPTNLRLQSLVIESIKRKVNAERNVRQKLEKRLKDQKVNIEHGNRWGSRPPFFFNDSTNSNP